MLTIDRYELTKKVYDINRNRAMSANCELELLVCDNGSQDRRVVEEFRYAAYHRVNSKNEGINKSFNQLYLRAKGDIICILGNDIEMPEHWLKEAMFYVERVDKCGIIGFDWGHGGVPEPTLRDGVSARWLDPVFNRVFGSWVVSRNLIDKIGLFHEGYGPYGIEDSDFNERVNRAGFHSLYHPTLKSKHLGWDVGADSPYRKMKDQSLQANAQLFGHRMREFEGPFKNLIDPLPEMREPI